MIVISWQNAGYGTLKIVTLSCDHNRLATLVSSGWSDNNDVYSKNAKISNS